MNRLSIARAVYVGLVVTAAACTKTEEPAPAPALSATAPVTKTATAPAKTVEDPRKAHQAKVDAAVEQFCSRCHVLPDPSQFTMKTWETAIRFKYGYLEKYNLDVSGAPPPNIVLRYYADRAAQTVRSPSFEPLERAVYGAVRRGPDVPVGLHSTADVLAVPRSDGFGGDFLASNMITGEIHVYDSAKPEGVGRVLAKLSHPSRIEVADLNLDGKRDIVAADLGTFGSEDHSRGQAVWLKRTRGQKFEKRVLLDNLGRVAQVAVGSLDDNRAPDIVVAEFGWLNSGALTLVLNAAKSEKKGRRVKKLDAGRGATSVAVGDLDGDGLSDIVALFGQEREEVVAYQNLGDGEFRARSIYRAPTPMWGSTRLRLFDLDQDGSTDVLVANGDALDSPRVADFQGVHLLRNQGSFRFEHKQILAMPGCHDFQVLDIDGDKDFDLVAVASLPPSIYQMATKVIPAGRVLASAVLLENKGDLNFGAQTLSDGAPCFTAIARTGVKGARFAVANFGLGWDILGHQQTITTRQTVINDCRSTQPVEVWDLVNPRPPIEEPPKLDRIQEALADRTRLHQREKAYERLLQTQPLQPDYHMGRGIALAQLRQTDKALEVMRLAVQINPKSEVLKVNVATLLSEIDEQQEAAKMAREVLKTRPKYAEAHNALAVALAKMGNYREALGHAKKAVEFKAGYLPYQFNLVHLYNFSGRAQEAINELNRILEASPGHPIAMEIRQQLIQQVRPPEP